MSMPPQPPPPGHPPPHSPGQPPYPVQYQYVYAVRPPTQASAVVSMIFGIVGVLLVAIPYAGFALGLVGVITGVVADVTISKSTTPVGGKGLAVTGIITGALAVLGGAIWIIITLAALFGAGD